MKGKFNLNKWLRSKSGMATIFGALAVLVIVAIVVGQAGNLFGTAGLPPYPKPAKGFTCLPTCADQDGRMLILPGDGVSSFGGQEVWVWLAIPGDATSFKVEIFDGDGGRDASGGFNHLQGNWDYLGVQTVYTLYADPVMSGYAGKAVATWNGAEMANNAWATFTVNNSPDAKGPNGGYFYLLKATRTNTTVGWNAFKVRSDGFVSMGSSTLASQTIGIMSAQARKDLRTYFPNMTSVTNLGTSTYAGDWDFKFYVPNKEDKIEIWDGDFDRGTSSDASADTDDPNTQGKPEWAVASAVDERAGVTGAPADNSASPSARRGAPVYYVLQDPAGDPIYNNAEPSGTEEWERFVLSTKGNQCVAGTNDTNCVEQIAGKIDPGFYNLSIQGLDVNNAVWLRVNFPICDIDEGCGFTPWSEYRCPRTIGYWKNNVKKVRAGVTRGVQETPQSINDGLKYVGFASQLFRGALVDGKTLNIQHNSADPAPLTLDEAYVILMRGVGDKDVYYFDNLDRRSMEARALQQNLATWLNLATNKIGANSIVTIPLPDGAFEGSLLEALQEAERLILSGQNLERAKNIADFINNNEFSDNANGEESAREADPNALACSSYEGGSVPKDKQPPSIKDMPKAPKPQPKEYTPAPQPVCSAGNTYTVENTTNNPFYSVKFNFASGTEVKNGGYDTFAITLPADVVSSMTSMQVEVKAATESRTITIEDSFTAEFGTGEPLRDPDSLYGVSFDGAVDNGDGTWTLKFIVYVFGNHGLSHVSFGLPEGQAALNLQGNYTSEQCVAAP